MLYSETLKYYNWTQGFSNDETVPVTKAITEGVHALSPSLWHALDIFRAVETKFYSSQDDLKHALLGLVECDIMTIAENWLDCACAIYLLGDSAHRDMEVLQTIERLFISNRKMNPAPIYNFIQYRPYHLAEESRKLWHKWSQSKCGANAVGETVNKSRPEVSLLAFALQHEVIFSFIVFTSVASGRTRYLICICSGRFLPTFT